MRNAGVVLFVLGACAPSYSDAPIAETADGGTIDGTDAGAQSTLDGAVDGSASGDAAPSCDALPVFYDDFQRANALGGFWDDFQATSDGALTIVTSPYRRMNISMKSATAVGHAYLVKKLSQPACPLHLSFDVAPDVLGRSCGLVRARYESGAQFDVRMLGSGELVASTASTNVSLATMTVGSKYGVQVVIDPALQRVTVTYSTDSPKLLDFPATAGAPVEVFFGGIDCEPGGAFEHHTDAVRIN